jgi:UDP-glucose:(heptosyl)LPS alpha-1,3-glucosyltransferase
VLLNAVSPSCAAQLAATFSIDPGTIRVIPPAIDPATFHPASPAERAAERARLAIPTGCPAIAVAANHAFGAKRVADLIVVAGRLGAHLLVCGVADRRLSDYQALAAHNGAAVSFLGAMSDMRAVYVAADVVALVSDYESYGMSVHEAMACGTPTVVSRGCGIADLVTDCKAVRLVDARDVDQISQSVAELLEPEVAQRVAAAGAAWARRRTWDDVVTEVEAELKRFAAGARTSSGS